MNWYKIRVDFIEEFEHECNCEYCTHYGTNKEDGFEISAFASINEDGAKQQAIDEIREDYPNAKNITAEILETREVPEGKFLFKDFDRILHLDNRWLSDGFVALDTRYSVSFSENIKTYDSPFEDMEPVRKLENYTIEKDDSGSYARYSDGCFNAGWVDALNNLGIFIHAVKGGNEHSPFALCKDGEVVGAIMPLRNSR